MTGEITPQASRCCHSYLSMLSVHMAHCQLSHSDLCVCRYFSKTGWKCPMTSRPVTLTTKGSRCCHIILMLSYHPDAVMATYQYFLYITCTVTLPKSEASHMTKMTLSHIGCDSCYAREQSIPYGLHSQILRYHLKFTLRKAKAFPTAHTNYEK